MTMTPTDAQLSAFLDGELSEREMQAVEKAINKNPELAARLELLSIVDEQLRSAFAPVLDEPIPDSVLGLLDDVENETPSNVIGFSARTERKNIWQLPAAIAASLMVGFFASQALNQRSDYTGNDGLSVGSLSQDSPVFTALSSQFSGQKNEEIEIILSFQSHEGNYCREFTSANSRGLACRDGGNWNIISQIYAPSPDSASHYATASAQSLEAFDALIEGLMDGEILDSGQERNLINSQWRLSNR